MYGREKNIPYYGETNKKYLYLRRNVYEKSIVMGFGYHVFYGYDTYRIGEYGNIHTNQYGNVLRTKQDSRTDGILASNGGKH